MVLQAWVGVKITLQAWSGDLVWAFGSRRTQGWHRTHCHRELEAQAEHPIRVPNRERGDLMILTLTEDEFTPAWIYLNCCYTSSIFPSNLIIQHTQSSANRSGTGRYMSLIFKHMCQHFKSWIHARLQTCQHSSHEFEGVGFFTARCQ
jgi:hypothetical protein